MSGKVVSETIDTDKRKEVKQEEANMYQEMDELFMKKVNSGDSQTQTGMATLDDYETHFRSMNSFKISLYFRLPSEERIGKVTTYYTTNSTNNIYSTEENSSIVEHLRNKNNGTKELSELLGTSIRVVSHSNSDEWQFHLSSLSEYTIESIDSVPEWDAQKRLSMEREFIDYLNTSQTSQDTEEKENHKQATTGVITDYYVKNGHSAFTQDLEIGIEITMPDDNVEMYECLHDEKENLKDDGLEEILDYCGNPEKLIKLKGEEIPVFHDEKENEYFIHLPSGLSGYVSYVFERSFINKTPIEKNLCLITKNYNHPGH